MYMEYNSKHNGLFCETYKSFITNFNMKTRFLKWTKIELTILKLNIAN